MNLCEKHKKLYDQNKGYINFPSVMGDARCDKHNSRMSFCEPNWKEYCPECARDNNICQFCGESLGEKL